MFNFIALHTSAQQLDFKHYEKRDGLPSGFIYDISQDSTNRLWIATGDGLVSFDGRSFNKELSVGYNTKDFVTTIHQDNDGVLWLGHYSGTIIRYTGEQADTIQKSNSGLRVQRICEVSKDSIIAFCQNSHAYLINNLSSTRISLPFDDQVIMDAHVGSSGEIFIGTGDGLYITNFSGEKLTTNLVLFPSQKVQAIISIGDRYLINTDKGNIALHKKNGNWTNISVSSSPFLSSGSTRILKRDTGQTFWMSTPSSLLHSSFDPDNDSIVVLQTYSAKHGFNPGSITTIFRDNDKNYWIGSSGKGLWQLRVPNAIYFSGESYPSLKQIEAAIYESDSSLLIGSSSGLYRITFQDLNFMEIRKIESLLADVSITALSLGRKYLWIGTDGQGLWKAPLGDKPRQIRSLAPIIGYDRINNISIDHEEKVWVGLTALGALVLDNEGNKVAHWNTQTGLSHNCIYQVFHDHINRHWFAVKGSALAMLDGKTFNYFGPKEGLHSLDFKGFVQSKDQTIWIATNGQGIFQYDNQEFKQFSKDDGLISGNVNGIALSDQEDIILATESGIQYLSGDALHTGKYRHFTQLDGQISGIEKMVPWKKDRLFLITHGGLLTTSIANESAENKIVSVIRRVNVNDELISLKANGRFDHGQYRFKFIFNSSVLDDSRPIQYWYLLEGYDDSWIGPISENSAYYTNLDEGEYSFKVRAALAGDNPGPVSRSFYFSILPPFWKTWWFIISSFIASGLLIYLIIRARTYRLEMANRKLESIVQERTEMLQKQNEDIKQFAYTITHDLKAPANNMVGLIHMMRKTGFIKEDGTHFIGMMENTAQHMRHSLERLMEQIRNRDKKEDEQLITNIPTIIEELKTNISSLIANNSAEIKTELEVDLIEFDRDNLFSILYNLTTNAIKYSSPNRTPEIVIESKVEDRYILIRVQDNGLGIDLKRDGEKLFGKFQRIHTEAEGSGVGLFLMKQMIEKSGGKVEVESTPGKGSVFSIYLPR